MLTNTPSSLVTKDAGPDITQRTPVPPSRGASTKSAVLWPANAFNEQWRLRGEQGSDGKSSRNADVRALAVGVACAF